MNDACDWRACALEIRLAHGREAWFQALLQGEDGLAVDRCLDPAGRVQQLWTTRAMLPALRAWLDSLPPELGLRVLREIALEGGEPEAGEVLA